MTSPLLNMNREVLSAAQVAQALTPALCSVFPRRPTRTPVPHTGFPHARFPGLGSAVLSVLMGPLP